MGMGAMAPAPAPMPMMEPPQPQGNGVRLDFGREIRGERHDVCAAGKVFCKDEDTGSADGRVRNMMIVECECTFGPVRIRSSERYR